MIWRTSPPGTGFTIEREILAIFQRLNDIGRRGHGHPRAEVARIASGVVRMRDGMIATTSLSEPARAEDELTVGIGAE